MRARMCLMRQLRGPHGLKTWPIMLALIWATGCARPTGLQSDQGTDRSDQHQVPFHDGDRAGSGGPGETLPTPDHSPNPDAGLPFHDSQNLPAGTLLTVRLKHPISADSSGNDGTFEAVVDEPVVVEGNRLVPRGATVSGRVESTRSSNLKRNRGYVRLALDSIHLSGGVLPIQTSSLFVRGNPGDGRVPQSDTPQSDASGAIHVEKGRRLTFRLTEPAYVSASQRTRVDR
jgi:hypothetical protein